MSIERILFYIAIGTSTISFIVFLSIVFKRKVPRKLNVDHFERRWQELQSLCKEVALWPEAIIEADNLLDEALRRRKMRGRTMGERLVSAQRLFTDNDGLWYGHKLRMKIESTPSLKLKQSDVKDALLGLRQALKDLGAL
jgi:hypothetical protein